MTPKSLLRLPQAASAIADMAEGTRFHPVLAEPGVEDEQVTRLVLCTGKIYYDLVGHPDRAAHAGLAVGARGAAVPVPGRADPRADGQLPEPEGDPLGAGGAAQHGRPRPHVPAPDADHAARTIHFGYVGRPERASPGEGYPAAHMDEQNRILTTAIDLRPADLPVPPQDPGRALMGALWRRFHASGPAQAQAPRLLAQRRYAGVRSVMGASRR